MPKTNPVSIRLEPALEERLESVAASLDRPKSWVITQALEEFVAVQEWHLAAIQAAVREADAGKGIPHEKVMEWVQSWGTPDEKPMPRSD